MTTAGRDVAIARAYPCPTVRAAGLDEEEREWALTVKQPWASLIMAGVKDVENRSWPAPISFHDGERTAALPSGRVRPFRLAIHAGKDWDHSWPARIPSVRDPSRTGVFSTAEDAKELRGVLLGSVEVTGCHHADECGDHPGCTCPMTGDPPSWHHDDCAAHDDAVRWYCSPWAEPDSWHWTLRDPQPLAEPIPMRGRQRLWTLPEGAA